MNRKGLFQSTEIKKPEYLQAYENSKAKTNLHLDTEQYAAIIRYYVSKLRFDEALEAIDNAMCVHGENAQIAIEEAYLYLDCDDVNMAQLVIEQFSDVQSDELMLLRAEIALSYKQIADSEIILSPLKETKDASKIIDAAYLYYDFGEYYKTKEWIDRVDKEHHNTEEYLLLCADYYFKVERFKNCELMFNQLININPFSPFYWWGLATARFKQRQFIEAIDACEMGLAADPTYVELVLLEGRIFQNNYQFNMAIELYERAIELNKEDSLLIGMLIVASKGLLKAKKAHLEGDAPLNLQASNSKPSDLKSSADTVKRFDDKKRGKLSRHKLFFKKELIGTMAEYNTKDLHYFLSQVDINEEVNDFKEADKELDAKDYESLSHFEESMSLHKLRRDKLVNKLKNKALEAYDSKDFYYFKYLLDAIVEIAYSCEHSNVIADIYCYTGRYKKAIKLYQEIYQNSLESENRNLYQVKFAYAHALFYKKEMDIAIDQEVLDKAKEIVNTDNILAVTKFIENYEDEEVFLKIIDRYFDTNDF